MTDVTPEKIRVLKDMIHEALVESQVSPIAWKGDTSPFEANRFQTYHADRLAEVLTTTDALDTLWAMVEGVNP